VGEPANIVAMKRMGIATGSSGSIDGDALALGSKATDSFAGNEDRAFGEFITRHDGHCERDP
jgi:hypothetical protein